MNGSDISKNIQKISTFFGYMGSAALFAIMLLTTVDVAGRYLFNTPLMGAFEITEYLIVILVFSFLGDTQSQKLHVSVDLLFLKFPKKLRYIADLLNHIACFAFSLLIAWMSFLKALEIKEVGEASPNLLIPDYPFVFFLVAGSIMLSLEYLSDIITIINKNNGGLTP